MCAGCLPVVLFVVSCVLLSLPPSVVGVFFMVFSCRLCVCVCVAVSCLFRLCTLLSQLEIFELRVCSVVSRSQSRRSDGKERREGADTKKRRREREREKKRKKERKERRARKG